MLQTIIADSIFIPMYVFLQLFVCLKCVGITTHKKRAFWIILIATLVLEIINCWLQAQPGYADSMLLQTLHSIVHALSTFIILAVIGIDGSGYLPRNFILIFFYMDFLTSLPIAPSALLWNMVLYKYLPEDGNNVAGSYHASLEIDVINLVVLGGDDPNHHRRVAAVQPEAEIPAFQSAGHHLSAIFRHHILCLRDPGNRTPDSSAVHRSQLHHRGSLSSGHVQLVSDPASSAGGHHSAAPVARPAKASAAAHPASGKRHAPGLLPERSRCSTGASDACATIFPTIWRCRKEATVTLC